MTLTELRNKLEAKRAALREVFKAAGTPPDLTRSEVLSLLVAVDAADALAKIRERNHEINDLFDEAKDAADLERISSDLDDVGAALGQPAPRHPVPPEARRSTIGAAITESDAFLAYRAARGQYDGTVADYGLREIRATLLETADGVAPESVRSGRLVEAVTRPIQVLDIIPSGNLDQAANVYMEEVLRTHSAAERREGAAYAEDAFKWARRSDPAVSIGTSLPVTDEQFEDVPGLRSYLDLRMTFGLRQRMDSQVLNGNGTPPNFEGLLNRGGIQTQAKGSDPVPDAIFKAMTKIRVVGRSNPTHVVLNPYDWQDIRLLRTADGVYIWGSPSEAVAARLWGAPVVQSDALAENTGLVGDFTFCQLLERRGLDVQVGYVNDDFTTGMRTIRADVRAAFSVYRAAAFCTVTSI